MNNIDKLICSEYLVKQAFLKRLTKMFKPSLSDLMKARRDMHITSNPIDAYFEFSHRYAKQHGIDTSDIPDDVMAKFKDAVFNNKGVYLPQYKLGYINRKNKSNLEAFISTKRHELLHGMQHSLPFMRSTLAGKVNKIPFVGKRFGALADELEAYAYQDPKYKLGGIRRFNHALPSYIASHKDTPEELGFKLYDKARTMWPLNKIYDAAIK